MLILALDPGKTTGYAIASIDRESLIGYGQYEFSHSGLWEFFPALVDYVVCESFEFRQGKQLGVDLYPCELIGVVKLWVDIRGRCELYMQPAHIQGKKAYFSDKLLKELGLYIKGCEHGRSAVKHLLHWLAFGPGSRFGIDVTKLMLTSLEKG